MVAEVQLRLRAPRPRWRRSGIVALVCLLASFFGVCAAPPAVAVTSGQGTVNLVVAPDNGGILGAGASLNVAVTIETTGSDPVPAGTVSLWLNTSHLTSGQSLSSWLSQSGEPSGMGQLEVVPTDVIEPGIPYTYRFSVPADQLPFEGRSDSATFGIGATLQSGSNTVATGRSVSVWDSGSAQGPLTKVAVAIPLTVPPTTDGIISAANLATYTAPGGILNRELEAAAANPDVAIGVDPMIIASIRALNGAAPPTATDWLKSLASLPNTTFALQYGDADPVGQLQSGLTKLLSPTSFLFALNTANFKTPATPIGEPTHGTGSSTPTPTPTPTASPANPNLPTAQQLLAWPYTLNGVAWPADGTVRGQDLSALASNGLTTTIVSSTNTNASTLSEAPGPRLTSDGSTVLVSDSVISTAARQAATATSTNQWNAAMAKVNARLELIASTATSQRTILVTLDRQPPTANGSYAHTLSSLGGSPWSTPATLQSAIGAAPTSGLAIKDASEPETRTASIGALLHREQSVDDFSSILDDPQTLVGQTRAQLLSTLGVGWLGPKQNWDQAVGGLLDQMQKKLHSVSILATENVNLVGTQASIPFTVSNGLPDEAVTVVLNAIPSNGRLDINSVTTKRIQADSRATLLVPVKAEVGNGKVTLDLQLYSKTGVKIGSRATVPVEVHADWEGIGALIVGVLLVLLFGFGVVRNILRRRRGLDAEAAEGGPSGSPETASSGGAGSAESAPTEAVPADAVPAESAPAESAPEEAIPAEAIPTEAVPTGAVPAESAPTEAAPAKPAPDGAGADEPAPDPGDQAGNQRG